MSTGDDPELAAALAAVHSQPTISVGQYARLLGVHRGTAYAHVNDGHIPVVRVGSRIRIPSAYVREQLDL